MGIKSNYRAFRKRCTWLPYLRIKQNLLAASANRNHIRRTGNIVFTRKFPADRFLQFGNTINLRIFCFACLHRRNRSILDMLRRIKIGLADFEMHNVAAVGFQGFGPGQDFECGFGAESLRYALLIVSMLLLAAGYHFWRASQTLADDL